MRCYLIRESGVDVRGGGSRPVAEMLLPSRARREAVSSAMVPVGCYLIRESGVEVRGWMAVLV